MKALLARTVSWLGRFRKELVIKVSDDLPTHSIILPPQGRVRAGEPCFTLRGDDPIASSLVRAWCDHAEAARVDPAKIAGARVIAGHMDGMDPEAIFTLRGQDQLAAPIVRLWIERYKNRPGSVQALVDDAEMAYQAMEAFHPKKLPD